MQARDFLLWVLLAGLWGSSFLAIGVAVRDVSPEGLVVARMGIGALVLGAFLLARGGSFALGPSGWALACVVGFTGNAVPFLLIGYAEQDVSTGLAALVMGIAPIVTLVLAPLIHPDELLSRRKLLGAVAGFSGVAALAAPDLAAGKTGNLLPLLALVSAALCYAVTALISRRFAYPDPMQIAAASVLAGALGLAAMMLLSGDWGNPMGTGNPALLAILYLGVGPTALAAMIYFYLIPRIGAGRLQQVNYVVPVLGTILGMVLLGEQPGWTTWPALTLIVCGVYLVTRSVGRRPAGPRSLESSARET